jgi:hypothetical protein
MKNYARIALMTAAIGTAAQAAPFLAIGDGAELFVTGTLGVRVDDNIFLASTSRAGGLPGEVDDTIFDINPGLELTFGKNSTLKGSLTLVDAFSNYTDNSDLNTNLFSGDFRSNFDDGKMKLKFNTGFHELNQNDALIQGLIRRDQFVIGTSGEVEVTQITSVSAGINFDHLHYKRSGYGDSDDLTVPLNFYYKWTPKIDLSVGYRYRNYETDASAARDSVDHYFNIGARGEFSPKLTGQFTVGVISRKLENGGTETLPGIDGSLTYEFSPKTSLQFGASNDYGTSPTGAQQKNFTLRTSATINLDEQWSLNGGISYRSLDYYQRFGSTPAHTDDFIEGSVGAAYIVNTYVKLSAAYTYRSNDSEVTTSDFKNNVFSIAASVRY